MPPTMIMLVFPERASFFGVAFAVIFVLYNDRPFFFWLWKKYVSATLWVDYYFFKLFFYPSVGNLGHFTYVRLQQLQEQCYTFLPVCAVLLCFQTMVWLQILGIFNVCTDMYAIAQEGCMDTIKESALKVDSGRKIPCCTFV